MKKFAIMLSAMILCSIAGIASANEVPVGCPVNKPCPCVKEKPCKDCEGKYEDDCLCGDPCESKSEYFTKRCDTYKKLGLSQTQTTQARALDEKYFGEIYSLRKCYQDAKRELEKMQCEKACAADIDNQKERVKDLKQQIKDKKKAYYDDFLCILTDCQKKDYKKMKKCKCWEK